MIMNTNKVDQLTKTIDNDNEIIYARTNQNNAKNYLSSKLSNHAYNTALTYKNEGMMNSDIP